MDQTCSLLSLILLLIGVGRLRRVVLKFKVQSSTRIRAPRLDLRDVRVRVSAFLGRAKSRGTGALLRFLAVLVLEVRLKFLAALLSINISTVNLILHILGKFLPCEGDVGVVFGVRLHRSPFFLFYSGLRQAARVQPREARVQI